MNQSFKTTTIPLVGLITWLLAALFFLYEFFLRTFVGSVAHQIIPDLHLSAESFALIGSAYYAAYGIMQIPVGILADKFGVKVILLFATSLCAGATLLFAYSTEFYLALISRLMMGFGSSFAFICLLVIASTWFPKRFFGFFAGASQFIGTIGPMLAGGPLVALIFALHTSWRTPLVWIACAGIILALLMLTLVKSKPKNNPKQLIMLAPEESLKVRFARLVKNKQSWYIALYSAATYVSIEFLAATWGTTYLQSRGLSQHYAASMISLSWLGYALGCPLLGILSDLAKRRKPILVFCALMGVSVTMMIIYAPLENFAWVYDLLFFGLGLAATGQNIGFATIAENVDKKIRATALGFNNSTILLFSTIIPPVASYFIGLAIGQHLDHAKPHDFTFGFIFMPVLYIIALFVALFLIKETYCKPQKEVLQLQA